MKAQKWGSHAPATANVGSHQVHARGYGASGGPLPDHDVGNHRVRAGAHGDSGRPYPDNQVFRSIGLVGDGSPTTVYACGYIFLNEEKAVTTPTMTGSVDAFAELDRSITEKVRFANGSVVDIHGRGTVVFANNGADHRAFTIIFFIPVLKSSVLSISQLDESWYDINIHRGVLSMRDEDRRLLIEVTRGSNRLHKFFFCPVQPMCLVVGHVSNAWRWHARLGHRHFDGL